MRPNSAGRLLMDSLGTVDGGEGQREREGESRRGREGEGGGKERERGAGQDPLLLPRRANT